MKKTANALVLAIVIIISCMLIVSVISFFPGILYPLEKDVFVCVQKGDMVTYDELDTPPSYITEYHWWFDEALAPITYHKLKKYIKNNHLAISSGEYIFKTTTTFDEILEILEFQTIGL